MKIIINEIQTDITRVVVIELSNGEQFRLRKDQFQYLEITKVWGDNDSSIHITPAVSNQIKLK